MLLIETVLVLVYITSSSGRYDLVCCTITVCVCVVRRVYCIIDYHCTVRRIIRKKKCGYCGGGGEHYLYQLFSITGKVNFSCMVPSKKLKTN